MSRVTEKELREIDRVNEIDTRPVVFVHGIWFAPSSWDAWRTLFDDNGYASLAPSWPHDRAVVETARTDPDSLVSTLVPTITQHYLELIDRLNTPPVVIGHSFGGLIAQSLAGEGVAATTIAIASPPIAGVPSSVLPPHSEAASGGIERFHREWVDTLGTAEAEEVWSTFQVPAPGAELFTPENVAALAAVIVDTANTGRGPLLLLAGADDRTTPVTVSEATYELQSRNADVTEYTVIPGRGHSLIVDHGWREVADTALVFAQNYAAPKQN